jgi:superfamily I DNA/RNA helicase
MKSIAKQTLQPMSEEQQIIFDHIKNKTNVITNACAGSGKSTTVLSIATHLPQEQIIQITYNTMLSKEIKEKINDLHIANMTVFTYHAIAVKYYSHNAYTDTELIEIVQKNKRPITEIPNFTIFVIDEAQDMTKL